MMLVKCSFDLRPHMHVWYRTCTTFVHSSVVIRLLLLLGALRAGLVKPHISSAESQAHTTGHTYTCLSELHLGDSSALGLEPWQSCSELSTQYLLMETLLLAKVCSIASCRRQAEGCLCKKGCSY